MERQPVNRVVTSRADNLGRASGAIDLAEGYTSTRVQRAIQHAIVIECEIAAGGQAAAKVFWRPIEGSGRWVNCDELTTRAGIDNSFFRYGEAVRDGSKGWANRHRCARIWV